MRRFGHYAVGVESGSIDIFSAFEDSGPMWAGEGPRIERREVRFDEPFVEPPVVHLSLSMWDMGVTGNQRADIKASQISREGFWAEFRTWGDTRVARVRASWMAVGPVPHLDDFDQE